MRRRAVVGYGGPIGSDAESGVPTTGPPALTREDVRAELERARVRFRQLLADASPAELRSASRGTRWTNEQLLFHMLFGYLIVRALLSLVRGFGRMPEPVGRLYARLLNAANRPFHVINYLGSCVGAVVVGRRGMARRMDRVINSLERRLDRETEESLALRMHFPVRWDPFFSDMMTVADVYHYATQHFDYHHGQLTLTN